MNERILAVDDEPAIRSLLERTLGKDADARAMAFVGLRCGDTPEHKELIYGAGEHSNIDRAAIAALISAMNRAAARGVFRRDQAMVQTV